MKNLSLITFVLLLSLGAQAYNPFFGAMTRWCATGKHKELGVCTANTKSCAVSNGTGSQTWNGIAWGSCAIASCNYGYYSNGSSCVLSTITVNYATYKAWGSGSCTTNNIGSQVAAKCNGTTSCSWKPLDWGDPAPGASKDACYSYSCGGNPTPKTGSIAPEAGFTTVTMTCP